MQLAAHRILIRLSNNLCIYIFSGGLFEQPFG